MRLGYAIALCCVLAVVFAGAGCTTGGGVAAGGNAQARPATDTMAATALDDLYRNNPSAKGLIESAAGYAIFDASRAAAAAGGNAQAPGVLVDNATRQRTYLAMLRPASGYGVPYDTFRRVIVFAGKDALDRFRASSSAGAAAAAVATPETTIVIFDLTGSGVIAVANWGTTKFVVDAPR